MRGQQVIRLCEWGRANNHDLTDDQRQALDAAARRWKKENRLSATPLYFEGADGKTLRARQYVGVVEAAGRTIEIYPKLDVRLIDRAEDAAVQEAEAVPVLRSLLWMLECVSRVDVPDADAAHLPEELNGFVEVWAHLLARNLRRELMLGAYRTYESETGDLSLVRGQIHFARQVGPLLNRMDKIACRWEHFTPDTPLNRLLLCACRILRPRVRHLATHDLLGDCIALLDDVEEVAPAVALQETIRLAEGMGWGRTNERFRRVFGLARQLLLGAGYNLGAGSADTFVFLIDMNVLFEQFCQAALEARFGVAVAAQTHLGYLLKTQHGRIRQKPDFVFECDDRVYIGDAKYKHLARGQKSLTFDVLGDADEEEESTPAGRVLSPSDVRQLGVYADLHQRKTEQTKQHLLLLYPFVGGGEAQTDTTTLWHDVTLTLCPVQIRSDRLLAEAVPVVPAFVQ